MDPNVVAGITVEELMEQSPSWYRAYQRAYDFDVRIVAIADQPGVFETSSKTTPGRWYLTSISSCTCRAGYAGIPCVHRAKVAVQLNVIEEVPFSA